MLDFKTMIFLFEIMCMSMLLNLFLPSHMHARLFPVQTFIARFHRVPCHLSTFEFANKTRSLIIQSFISGFHRLAIAFNFETCD